MPVYEAGRWPNGLPFYAMKLVSGRSLAHLVEAMRTLRERLAALPHCSPWPRPWLSSGESRPLQGHEGPVIRVLFSRDGRQVLSAGHDGTVRVWRDDLPREPAALRAWLHQVASR